MLKRDFQDYQKVRGCLAQQYQDYKKQQPNVVDTNVVIDIDLSPGGSKSAGIEGQMGGSKLLLVWKPIDNKKLVWPFYRYLGLV